MSAATASGNSGPAAGWVSNLIRTGVLSQARVWLKGVSSEFLAPASVQSPVQCAANRLNDGNRHPEEPGVSRHFSFGQRRFASKGPRRLFVPQESAISPVFEPEVERRRAILRVQSSCA